MSTSGSLELSAKTEVRWCCRPVEPTAQRSPLS
jgi:hypothetical protein